MLSRRSFLKSCAFTLLLTQLDPVSALQGPKSPTLVMVQLEGGNDALNTLVPYKDPLYARLRPHLALKPKSLLTLDSNWALHPSLRATAGLHQEGAIGWFPGIGRPDHDRSHFRSSDLWHTAGDVHQEEGWLAQLARETGCEAVNIANNLSRSLFSPHHPSYSFREDLPRADADNPALFKELLSLYEGLSHGPQAHRCLKNSARMLEKMTTNYRRRLNQVKLPVRFDGETTGKRFELLARFLAADLPPRIFHLGVGEYDTHDGQLGRHAKQLADLDRALDALWKTVRHLGKEQEVLVVVYSEFGRRIQENLNGGTDHGAGGLAFTLGGALEGGVHGRPYDLHNDRDGDLAHQLDYRRLYATALEKHFAPGTWRSMLGDFRPLEV